jgi:hypothetical protein
MCIGSAGGGFGGGFGLFSEQQNTGSSSFGAGFSFGGSTQSQDGGNSGEDVQIQTVLSFGWMGGSNIMPHPLTWIFSSHYKSSTTVHYYTLVDYKPAVSG